MAARSNNDLTKPNPSKANPVAGMTSTANDRPILRFLTCGSVDDGKSTLIGRLLYDYQLIPDDTLATVESDSRTFGTTGDSIDFALLVDGLQAEREQGITIDVAYRYFATPERKFIVADTPGHEQYTRNMVTGASTCDLAVILVDARKGLLTQTLRHTCIVHLLGIKHVVLAVNKMDLVDYQAETFNKIEAAYQEIAKTLEIPNITTIPLSARDGDNLIEPSKNMPWYKGTTLLRHLETVDTKITKANNPFRMPVQWVCRPDLDFRGYAGSLASGSVSPGDEVIVLPPSHTSRIDRIVTQDGDLAKAESGDAVVLTLTDEIDISRGDMICRPNNQPVVTQDIDAMICWMDDTASLQARKKYSIKHSTRAARVMIKDINYRLDINTLHRDEEATEITLNEIGRISFRSTVPLFIDEYRRNRHTGSFVLIDEATNATVAAGMILGEAQG